MSILDRFSKKKKPVYEISWKSVQWEPCCSHADGKTDGHEEANIRFSNYSNAPISVDCFIVVSVNGHNCSVQQVRSIMSVRVTVMWFIQFSSVHNILIFSAAFETPKLSSWGEKYVEVVRKGSDAEI